MKTQTLKVPHYAQVLKKHKEVKATLIKRMNITELEYYYQEFHFGIDLLDAYFKGLDYKTIDGIKYDLMQNPIYGYWRFIKNLRRQKEQEFCQQYEPVYEDNLY